MTAKDVSLYFKLLLTQQQKISSANSVSDIHIALKELHRTIKKCCVHVSNPSFLAENEQEVLYSLIKTLTFILTNDTFLADVMFLCGTCISLLVITMFDPKFSSSFLIYIYCYFDRSYSGTKKLTSDFLEASKKRILEDLKLFIFKCESHISVSSELCKEYMEKNSLKCINTPSFYQIAVLNGIASCRTLNLFSFKVDFCQNKTFFVFIFNAIHMCCLSPSIHQYHAFNVLLNWMRMCETCIPAISTVEDEFFSANSEIVQKVLCLLESNWQSPIKGINGFVKEMYKILITLSKQECLRLGTNDALVQHLLKKSILLSWQAKGKYFMLSAVFQHINYSEFFEKHPDAPLKMIFNLKTNYIASSVAEVYKVIVTNMKNYNSVKNLYLEWCKWWRAPIINCLCSNDKLLIQNVTNIILPWTMKHLPKSYELMMEVLNQAKEDFCKLLLLRIAKENVSFVLGEKELILIGNNLCHDDILRRTEILAILCASPKKSEPVKARELDFLKDFIKENLNIDSAPFHHHLLSQLRILLTRIRDSLAQEYRSGIWNSDGIHDFSQLEFVDWLAHTAIQNTFPGACYQRRRVSLQILNLIFDVFIQSPMGFKRKEKPSKSVELMIEWAQKNNFWNIFSDNTLLYVLPCITDFTDEIRTLCADLLLKYSSWPLMDDCNVNNMDTVTEFAVILCNHPDFRNNDGGAHICCIIFKRLCSELREKEYFKALEFLEYLVATSKLQLVAAKEDFLAAAVSKPVHGMLLALQYSLANSENFMSYSYQFQAKKTMGLLKESIQVCFDTVEYMLGTMKGDNGNYNCPSFLDIDKAMEKLVLSKKNSYAENSSLNGVNIESSEDSDHTSSDLLLSCCWHCIKNSCFLLCEISALISSLNINYTEKKQMLQEISKLYACILIACRHRGVVEACCNALNKFCTSLLKDKAIYEDITLGLLKSVFENLEDTSMVSVTRRSAGLPLLFQAVVSSEENNINRKLLSYTVENLLNLVNKPLPSKETISEKTDLPQAHSYHILKSLISDASLSQCILPYFDTIIPVCVSGFSSSVWIIRNGALQLFGVILPRVCGQKKVRDDDSEHNMVSAFELFARCPSLKVYLLQELTKCVKYHHEKRLCSELVPVLSLLVKLMPEQEEQRAFMVDFTPLLLELLDIPVWKVRDLVSSALSVMLTSTEVMNLLSEVILILKSSAVNRNKIHSILLVIQKFLRRNCNNILSSSSDVEKYLKNMYPLMEEKLKCPLLSGMVIDLMLLVSEARKDLSILRCIEESKYANRTSQNYEVGFVFYDSKVMLACLKLCSSSDLPLFLKKLSSKDKHIQIVCLQFLSKKLNSEKSAGLFYAEDNLKSWREIFMSTIDFISPENHPSLIKEALELMISLSSDWPTGKVMLGSCSDSVISRLLNLLDLQSGLTVSALSFTMWSICIKGILHQQDHNLCLEKWSLLFSAYCHPRSTDILRMQAARSLAILGSSLSENLKKYMKTDSDTCVQTFISLCEGALFLLQDEDQEIRNEACKFPSQLPHSYLAKLLQFNIGIKVVFEYMLQVLHTEPYYLSYLWNRLQNYPPTVKILQSYCKVKKGNLFEQEYVNVFAEPHQLLMLYQSDVKTLLLDLNTTNYQLYCEKIETFVQDLKLELQDVYSILSSINTINLNQNFTYHHHVFLALKKLRCQTEVLVQQRNVIMADNPLMNELNELNEEWCNTEKLLPTVTCWFLNQL